MVAKMKLNGPDKGPITQLKTYHTTRDLRHNSENGNMTQLPNLRAMYGLIDFLKPEIDRLYENIVWLIFLILSLIDYIKIWFSRFSYN